MCCYREGILFCWEMKEFQRSHGDERYDLNCVPVAYMNKTLHVPWGHFLYCVHI